MNNIIDARHLAELTRQNLELEERNSLLLNVLGHMEKGFAIFSRGEWAPGCCNPPWTEMVEGLDEHEQLAIEALCHAATRGGKARTFSLEPSSTGVFLSITARPLDPQRVLVLVRDITREQLERQRMLARQESLEQFAHVVSHDLRAPLRHIRGFVEILSEELPAQEPLVQDAMESILGGVDRMRSLINGLLTYSEAGRYSPSEDEVCLQEQARQAWSICAPAGELMLKPLPKIVGDPLLLGQLFQNLFENASKFRHPQRPLIVTICARSAPGGWHVDVTDSGIGIPREHQARVFGIFQQLHLRGQYEGYGIGLSVCQRVMAQHDGSIEAISDGHSGTTFRLFFPRRPRGHLAATA